jgi:hypothetical protein
MRTRKEALLGVSMRLPERHVSSVETLAKSLDVRYTDLYKAMIEVTASDSTVLNKVKKVLATAGK